MVTDLVERLRSAAHPLTESWPDNVRLTVLAKLAIDAAIEIERLREQARSHFAQLDRLYGTPCEEIRHAEQVEDLKRERDEALVDAENQRKALRVLRPVWAHGWTDDSIAAQVTASALGRLWEMLGAKNQDEAVEHLTTLQARVAEIERIYNVGFAAGFEAAREMAARIANERGYTHTAAVIHNLKSRKSDNV